MKDLKEKVTVDKKCLFRQHLSKCDLMIVNDKSKTLLRGDIFKRNIISHTFNVQHNFMVNSLDRCTAPSIEPNAILPLVKIIRPRSLDWTQTDLHPVDKN